MRSYVEPARGNPLRDDSEQAQSSHIDLRIQGGKDLIYKVADETSS